MSDTNPWPEATDLELIRCLNGPWTDYFAAGTDGMLASEAALRISRLTNWKEGALIVLNDWDLVWEAAGRPGPLAGSKAANVASYIARSADDLMTLRAELAEFKQWAADACELLHDIGGTEYVEMFGDDDEDRRIGLLRRMENP